MTTKFRGFKLAGKTAAHLKSMLRCQPSLKLTHSPLSSHVRPGRTQVTQLIKYERIETTLPKAKLLKRFADKMVTLGKKESERASTKGEKEKAREREREGI
eukprot:541798-Amorphochlora_amoeboformis.AAC.2